eukprot:549041-Rhodomonas_salina.2
MMLAQPRGRSRSGQEYTLFIAASLLPLTPPALQTPPPSSPQASVLVSTQVSSLSLLSIDASSSSFTLSGSFTLSWTDLRLASSLSNPAGSAVLDAEAVLGRRVTWEPPLHRNSSLSFSHLGPVGSAVTRVKRLVNSTRVSMHVAWTHAFPIAAAGLPPPLPPTPDSPS